MMKGMDFGIQIKEGAKCIIHQKCLNLGGLNRVALH